jgi:hypothetical protein
LFCYYTHATTHLLFEAIEPLRQSTTPTYLPLTVDRTIRDHTSIDAR